MEQELASIAKFILTALGSGVYPYYRELPESFHAPAVYFPNPDVTMGADTLNTYRADYQWRISFICADQQDAYRLGQIALTAIKKNRDLVPLLSATGSQLGKRFFRLKAPELRVGTGNTVFLNLRFTVRKSYTDNRGAKVVAYDFNEFLK